MPETTVHVTLPEMGESVSEGSIVEWHAKVGGWIDEGATLVDVTTDKVDVEIPAPVSGLVAKILVTEGETVGVGTVLAEIDSAATRPAESPAPTAEPKRAPAEAAKTIGLAPAISTANGSAAPRAQASHRARRFAERENLDLLRIRGTGPNGMIVLADVVRAAASADAAQLRGNGSTAAQPALPPLSANAKVVPLRGPAGSLVGYMEQSLSVPTATSFRTIGVGILDLRRSELNAAIRANGRSEKISFTHLIAFALVRAARANPAITHSFRRENGIPSRVEAGIHLGLAVDASRKDGSRFLVVPAIKNAEALDFIAFRAAYEDLVAKARDNKLSADELTGASFTLTNPGGIGTVASVPRLMAGQGAIIAAGSIALPAGLARANEAGVRALGVEKVMTLSSTYDHRVIQGAQSGEYLRRVDELLGGAEHFYDEVFAGFGLTPIAMPVFGTAAPAGAVGELLGTPSADMLRAIAGGMALVEAFRRHGHLAATLDPLGVPSPGDPSLNPASYMLTPALQAAIPASVLGVKVPGTTLADVLPRLRETYASTIAYEIEHISATEERLWLRDYIESGRHRIALSNGRKVQLLQRLTKVETMERYFRKQFMSQKTFSIEGLDVMVPMLEETISLLADDGVATVAIGMAHRGRLSTIAHVVNRPYEELLAEFEAGALKALETPGEDAMGDVKYHHGAQGVYKTPSGKDVTVKLANNPSHLEAVDGVVEGMTRCLQTDHRQNPATVDVNRAVPILIHGDAAFAGQGVVAEVFNLQGLRGYATGGTLHLIANNQVGFTTDPSDGRSTRYASDLAKGFDAPIVHVNADDVDACIAAARLAHDYRRQFCQDVVIDLIGYRRFGHNEQDEPAYTQPAMAEAIHGHPSVRELFASKLVAQGVLSQEEVAESQAAATARIGDAHKTVHGGGAAKLITQHAKIAELAGRVGSSPVSRESLLAWADALTAVPADFTINRKLAVQFERRKAALQKTGEVDWGLAEGLAFASLLAEGVPIRLTGQDTERGTFSHRHAVLHDPQTGRTHVPLQAFAPAKAAFEIYNSPLSEYACVGFEYGYSTELTNALVLWEAQFGDFNNGAQIVIDQFIAAGQAKWGETSRLVLLLPHGYEGAGPEHSSARIERFLQLSSEGSMQVANCSTAAQYFHLLRLQARQTRALPLVIFTPKSLLRRKAASGHLDELADGAFHPVLDDAKYAADRAAVERIVLCSGKIYYDILDHADYAKAAKTAVIRVELLSPLPLQEIVQTLEAYPNVKYIVWAQEEPKNMGARAHVRRRIFDRLPNGILDLDYIGRPYRASPSEGYGGAHALEQDRIVRAALAET